MATHNEIVTAIAAALAPAYTGRIHTYRRWATTIGAQQALHLPESGQPGVLTSITITRESVTPSSVADSRDGNSYARRHSARYALELYYGHSDEAASELAVQAIVDTLVDHWDTEAVRDILRAIGVVTGPMTVAQIATASAQGVQIFFHIVRITVTIEVL